ncbi:MAG: branched-chain amino acid ABC transporter permease [Rhodospirillaceae bacterium]|nr:branched-chain amino acid ABC transporter permease [Rhodospirillaceae bacterium]
MIDRTVWGLFAALLVVLGAGFIAADWAQFLLVLALAKGMVVLGLLVLMRAGLVSFGQGLWYGLGCYAAGMAGNFLGVTDAFLLLALGIAASTTVAFILGFLLSRYREIFFALLNMAFSMILFGVLVKTSVLGSTDGFNVLTPTFLGYAPSEAALGDTVFLLTAVISFVVAVLIHWYLGSTMGFIGEAIRENELRVEYLGVSARRAVHIKLMIAAALSGIGGVLTAIAVGHVDPEMTYWTTSGEFVFVAILSGTGSVAAPFMGSIIFEVLRTYAYEYSPYTWQMLMGAVMLLVIIFLPGGLWSALSRSRKGEGK